MLLRIFRFLLLACFLSQCTTKPTETSSHTETDYPAEPERMDNRPIPEKLLSLNTSSPGVNSSDSLSGNLYGRFFCDRIEFYIIDKPQNLIYSTHPETVTLYYLDGQLRKVKYVLTEDISSKLIRELGSFKIIGLDQKNRDIISEKQVIKRVHNQRVVNPSLDNYELRWTVGDKEVKYRVVSNSLEPYRYVEKMQTYEREFNAIERLCL